MRFKEIPVNKLKSFLESDIYKKNTDLIAISRLRALSQIKNPSADAHDIVLILALNSNEKIVGFVGALPEKLSQYPNLKTAWNSCWYVSKGNGKYAIPLFYKFMSVYNSNIMMRDMTAHTKKILLQTGRFSVIKNLKGVRLYFSLNLTKRLPELHSILRYTKLILKIIDFLIDSFVRINNKIFIKKQHNLRPVYIKNTDKESEIFINKHNHKEIFNRKPESLNWIINNPWITDNPTKEQISEQQKYFFSIIKNQVLNTFVKLYKSEELISVMFLSLINGELRIPYLYFDKKNLPYIANFISRYIIDKRCKTFITFNSELAKSLKREIAFPFLKREFEKEFVVSKTIEKYFTNKFNFQDGESDFVFV